MIQNLKRRLDCNSVKVKSIYIDNCCQWRTLLQNIFGDEVCVKLDLFHAVWQRIVSKTSQTRKKVFYSKRSAATPQRRSQGCRQALAWVGASAGCMRDLGGSWCTFTREILKTQVVEVHFSCILRVIFTLPLRLSGPLRRVTECRRT